MDETHNVALFNRKFNPERKKMSKIDLIEKKLLDQFTLRSVIDIE